MRNSKYFSTLLILVCAFLGLVLVMMATPFGIGTSPDSVIYLNAADNLLAGNGITVTVAPGQYQPLSQYPPFFPALLAGTGIFGIEPYQAGRWLAGIIYALNIFLVGIILKRFIPESIWPALTAALLMLFAPVMVGIHVMAWSEPLFIFLSMLSFLSLTNYLDKSKWVWLLVASILAGFATLTRYAGAAVIATSILGLFLLANKSRLVMRLRDALLFALISFIPLALLLAINQLTTGNATNRVISFHLISRSQLWEGLTTLTSWFGIPGTLPTWGHILLLIAFPIILLILLLKNSKFEHENNSAEVNGFQIPNLIALLFLFVLIYGMFLVISISFIDANTPLDNRILSPVYVSLLIIVIYSIAKFILTAENPRIRQWLSLGLVILIFAIYSNRSFPMVTQYQEHGIGFSSPEWQNSNLLQEVRTFPSGTLFYSNIPEAITLLAKQAALRLPRKFEVSSQQINTDFAGDLQSIEKLMDSGEAVIVFFNQGGRLENPSIADLQQYLDLVVIHQDANGTIYSLDHLEEQ